MAGNRAAVPPDVAEKIRHFSPDIKRALRAAIRTLCLNPASGDALQGELQGFRKYRVRRFRIVYQVDHPGKVLRIVAVGHRRSIYEEVAEIVRRQK